MTALLLVLYRKKKEKGIIFPSILTFFHFLILGLMTFIFLTIALPQREDGDFQDISIGLNKMMKKFLSDNPSSHNDKSNKKEQKNSSSTDDPPGIIDENEKRYLPHVTDETNNVKDPF